MLIYSFFRFLSLSLSLFFYYSLADKRVSDWTRKCEYDALIYAMDVFQKICFVHNINDIHTQAHKFKRRPASSSSTVTKKICCRRWWCFLFRIRWEILQKEIISYFAPCINQFSVCHKKKESANSRVRAISYTSLDPGKKKKIQQFKNSNRSRFSLDEHRQNSCCGFVSSALAKRSLRKTDSQI